jgi:hypothetical protein
MSEIKVWAISCLLFNGFPSEHASAVLRSAVLNYRGLKLSKSLEKSHSSLICHAYEKAYGTRKFSFRNSSLVGMTDQTRQYA